MWGCSIFGPRKSNVLYLTIDVGDIMKDVGGSLISIYVKIRDSIRGSIVEEMRIYNLSVRVRYYDMRIKCPFFLL
jgi:hypothetical protein